MAKKKSKKSKSVVPAACSAIAVILGLVAVIMMFLPAICITDTETTFTGLEITFGVKDKILKTPIFEFSFMSLLTYILALGGIVFAILSALGKGSKFASFISAGLFIVAGVFFFMAVTLSVPNEKANNIVGAVGDLFGSKADIRDIYSLAIGSIIGGIASILAGVCSLAKVFAK